MADTTSQDALTALAGLLSGNTSVLTGKTTLAQMLQALRNYSTSSLATDATDYDALQEAIYQSSSAPLLEQRTKDVQSLQENLASRGVGLTSGPWNQTMEELYGDYASQLGNLSNQAAASRWGIQTDENESLRNAALNAATIASNYALGAGSNAAQNYSTNMAYKTTQDAADAAATASLFSGIGSLAGTLLPSVTNLLGNLFTKNTSSTGTNYSDTGQSTANLFGNMGQSAINWSSLKL